VGLSPPCTLPNSAACSYWVCCCHCLPATCLLEFWRGVPLGTAVLPALNFAHLPAIPACWFAVYLLLHLPLPATARHLQISAITWRLLACYACLPTCHQCLLLPACLDFYWCLPAAG